MAQKLILEMVDGQKVEASLIGSFRPDDGEIDILIKEKWRKMQVTVYRSLLPFF